MLMTGPGHYVEAETRAQRAADAFGEGRLEDADLELKFAQVHAVLANAAATALSSFEGLPQADFSDWLQVASLRPPQ